MILMLVIVFLSVTLSIGLMVWIIYRKKFSQGQVIMKRVDTFVKQKPAMDKSDILKIIKEDSQNIPFVNRILSKGEFTKRLECMLEQAGSNMKVNDFIGQVLLLSIIGFVVSFLFKNLLLKIIVIGFIGSIPILRVQMQKIKRLKAFIREFPDALDMMTSAIRAGHALNQAIQLVGVEAPDPVGVEFKKTFEQYNLGLNLREALFNLTNRVDSLDLKLFITAVLLQRETGGNLTEILENISYTIRERFKLIGQIKTYTAQGRMSAWILGLLPLSFVLIISFLNPGYLSPLLNDFLGHYLLAIATFLQVLGFIIIQKIIKIKYQ